VDTVLDTIKTDTQEIEEALEVIESWVDSSVLKVKTQKAYSSETAIMSSQAVAGNNNFTTSAITNNANIEKYVIEHAFSGSQCSYEVLESLTSGGTYFSLQGVFNSSGSPSSSESMMNSIVIASPFFKIKVTNANGSSRDSTMSYVAITT
jgi:hypothetical protein